MRILLIHPEDPLQGAAWAQGKWDLVVDLGNSSKSVVMAWRERLGCPVLVMRSLSRGPEDLRRVKEILGAGRGRLLDEHGLDWWELIAILIHEEIELALLLERMASELRGDHEIYASGPGWLAEALASLLRREVKICDNPGGVRRDSRLNRFQHLLRDFSGIQLADIFFDKCDPEYKWRSLCRIRRSRARRHVVLVPSAYTNVSRMAAEYARMLPDQRFLFVATRRSAMQFQYPANVFVAHLSRYGRRRFVSRPQYQNLLRSWRSLETEIRHTPPFGLLWRMGRLQKFPALFRQGLAVRDAWNEVFESESVTAVLCGDDSNPYTRIPVLLARKRGLPTVDFHHGALDGRFLLKDLPSDLFLAKSEMERDYLLRVCGIAPETVVLGAPAKQRSHGHARGASTSPSQIVLFSEPYEAAERRADEVYRELLPPLAALARQFGISLLIKLHPFESVKQRSRLVQHILPERDLGLTKVVGCPLSDDMLRTTWFGITVESTTVLDCALQNVPCFLCEWLTTSSYGYLQQYARFGVGFPIKSAAEIAGIPGVLAVRKSSSLPLEAPWQPIEPDILRGYLCPAAAASSHAGKVTPARLTLSCEQGD